MVKYIVKDWTTNETMDWGEFDDVTKAELSVQAHVLNELSEDCYEMDDEHAFSIYANKYVIKKLTNN